MVGQANAQPDPRRSGRTAPPFTGLQPALLPQITDIPERVERRVHRSDATAPGQLAIAQRAMIPGGNTRIVAAPEAPPAKRTFHRAEQPLRPKRRLPAQRQLRRDLARKGRKQRLAALRVQSHKVVVKLPIGTAAAGRPEHVEPALIARAQVSHRPRRLGKVIGQRHLKRAHPVAHQRRFEKLRVHIGQRQGAGQAEILRAAADQRVTGKSARARGLAEKFQRFEKRRLRIAARVQRGHTHAQALGAQRARRRARNAPVGVRRDAAPGRNTPLIGPAQAAEITGLKPRHMPVQRLGHVIVGGQTRTEGGVLRHLKVQHRAPARVRRGLQGRRNRKSRQIVDQQQIALEIGRF